MKNNPEKNILDFLTNDDFIKYVVHPTRQLSNYWKLFFTNHPDQNKFAQSAKEILTGESGNSEKLSDEESNDLKKRIVRNCLISYNN